MRNTTVIVTAFAGVLLMVALLLTCILPLQYRGSELDTVMPLQDAWRYADGSAADPASLTFDENETAVIYLDIPRKDIQGRSLCFVTRNVLFTIYNGDAVLYDFHPDLSGLYGKFYGDQEHMVQLPTEEDTVHLRIECESLIQLRWTGISDIMLEHSSTHLQRILYHNAGKFALCMVTFSAGMVFFILGLVEQFLRKRDMLETMSLGVIAMTLAAWTSFPTHVIQLVSGNFAASRVFEYVSLMVLPIPVLVFVCALTKSMDSPLLHIGTGLCVANLFIQFGAVWNGIEDYHNMLYLSHVLIVVGIAFVGILIWKAIRRNAIDREQRQFLIGAITIIFAAGLLDMIRYYVNSTVDASQITRIGLFVFVCILSVYEFRKLMNIQSKGEMAEEMRRLAMEDPLTGLLNRTAFNRFEEDVKKRTGGKCLFVQLDVNYLKKVNDTYGHSEGDRHIVAAATILKESFGQYGKVYRVGGDEFIAVLESKECDQEYLRAVTAFRVKQQQYNDRVNPPVKLQIACGMAEYDFSDCNPEEAERLADTRMYENKKSLKLANA